MTTRKKIADEICDLLLFECNRTCCICELSGKDVQIHHINQRSSNNTYENLIVLCLQCHSEVHKKGGLGRNWTIGQLKQHKREWIKRVKKRKRNADKLASIEAATGIKQHPHDDLGELEYRSIDDPLLGRYLAEILIIHQAQKKIAQLSFDTGVTMDTNQACDKLVDFYETVLVELASFYPKGHFQSKHPKIFFSEQIATRAVFQGYSLRPEEGGFFPSMHRQFMMYRYMLDVRKMVRDIVVCLLDMAADIETDREKWANRWMKD